MPYAKILGIGYASLENVILYLADKNHSHHIEYFLTPLQFRGVKTPQQFCSRCRRNKELNGKILRSGRKAKTTADWAIVRMPDQTQLSQVERAEYEARALEALYSDNCVSAYNWHVNSLTGACDLNILLSHFTDTGLLRRDRDTHPVKRLRDAMDATTLSINLGRVRNQQRPIQTMATVVAAKEHEFDIVAKLASLPRYPSSPKELAACLILVGCRLVRFNPKKNYLSLVKPNRKAAKRFKIDWLLQKVAEALVSLKRSSPKPTLPSQD